MTTRFVLPEDSLDRMRDLINASYVEEKFHAKIAEHAGEDFDAFGFMMMWMLAVGDYIAYVNGPPALQAIMDVAAQQYARKLIDDETALAEVLALYERAGLPISFDEEK